jgi:hypothetical protein
VRDLPPEVDFDLDDLSFLNSQDFSIAELAPLMSSAHQLQGMESHAKPRRRPAIKASVREMMRTQNIARGPVPWRAWVAVTLVGMISFPF